MRCARALPITPLMPAAGPRTVLPPPLRWVDAPERMSGRTPLTAPHAGHPIHHHVAGPLSVDPDKGAGTRNALPHHVLSREGRR